MVNVIIPDNYLTLVAALAAKPLDEFWDILIRSGNRVMPSSYGIVPAIILKDLVKIHGDPAGKIPTNDPATWSKTVLQRTGLGDLLGTTTSQTNGQPGTPLTNFTLEDITLDGLSTTPPANGSGSCFGLSHNSPTPHRGVTLNRVVARRAGAGFAARNILGTDYGAGIGALLKNCYSENCWTNQTFVNSAFIKILDSEFRMAGGDAIFPQGTDHYMPAGSDGVCHNWIIEDNYIEDANDTGIDITVEYSVTSTTGGPPHTDITARRNILKNSSVRISNASNIWFEDNRIDGGMNSFGRNKGGISCDNGSVPTTVIPTPFVANTSQVNQEVHVNRNVLGMPFMPKHAAIVLTGTNMQLRDNKFYLASGVQSLLQYSTVNADVGNNQVFQPAVIPPLPLPTPISPLNVVSVIASAFMVGTVTYAASRNPALSVLTAAFGGLGGAALTRARSAPEGLSWPEGLVCETCGALLEVPEGTPPSSEVICPRCGAVYETTIL